MNFGFSTSCLFCGCLCPPEEDSINRNVTNVGTSSPETETNPAKELFFMGSRGIGEGPMIYNPNTATDPERTSDNATDPSQMSNDPQRPSNIETDSSRMSDDPQRTSDNATDPSQMSNDPQRTSNTATDPSQMSNDPQRPSDINTSSVIASSSPIYISNPAPIAVSPEKSSHNLSKKQFTLMLK